MATVIPMLDWLVRKFLDDALARAGAGDIEALADIAAIREELVQLQQAIREAGDASPGVGG